MDTLSTFPPSEAEWWAFTVAICLGESAINQYSFSIFFLLMELL